MPQIQEEYVDTGKVKIVYYHFPFIGEESTAAALASECAGEQGAFWGYHDLLFENQRGYNAGAFSNDNLKGFADDLGLDSGAFSTCLDTEKYLQIVVDGRSLGLAKGVASTPTIFIGGERIQGAASFEQVKSIIDQLLADLEG